MAARVDFNGTWKNVKNENLDDFLKALKVNFAARKIAATQSPVLEITQDGDVFKIVTRGFKTFEVDFTVGREFVHRSPFSSDPDTLLPAWDGDKLRVDNVSHPEGIRVVRQLVDGQLHQTQTIGAGEQAVACKRIFAKKK